MPPDVRSETQRLLDCDLLVVHFRLWWFAMPAILKGWVDRVFVYGPRPLVQYNRDHNFDETKRLLPDAPVHSPFVRHQSDAIPQ